MSSSSDSFHKQLIAEKGIDEATGFSHDGQYSRFEVIVDRCIRRPTTGETLLDYGCNVGDLFGYMWNGGWKVNYTGVDVMPEFLNRLKERFGDRGVKTVLGSITDDVVFQELQEKGPYDYVIASGAFCYADQIEDHSVMLHRLWSLSRDTLVVNFLSDWVSKERRTSKLIHSLYHPEFGPRLAGILGCKCFALYHDYRENDFTLALYRQFAMP